MVAVQWLLLWQLVQMVHCIHTFCQPSSKQGFLEVTTTTRMLIRKCLFSIISVLVSLVSCSDERYCDSWMWLIVHLNSNFSCGTRFSGSKFAIGGRDATHGPWTVSLGELYWINLPTLTLYKIFEATRMMMENMFMCAQGRYYQTM